MLGFPVQVNWPTEKEKGINLKKLTFRERGVERNRFKIAYPQRTKPNSKRNSIGQKLSSQHVHWCGSKSRSSSFLPTNRERKLHTKYFPWWKWESGKKKSWKVANPIPSCFHYRPNRGSTKFDSSSTSFHVNGSRLESPHFQPEGLVSQLEDKGLWKSNNSEIAGRKAGTGEKVWLSCWHRANIP